MASPLRLITVLSLTLMILSAFVPNMVMADSSEESSEESGESRRQTPAPPVCTANGAVCNFGRTQCCTGLDCLLTVFPNFGFFCQSCLPVGAPCNSALPFPLAGSCCSGTSCRNLGLGPVCATNSG